MRRSLPAIVLLLLAATSGAATAQTPPSDPSQGKPNATPCSEEVSAALKKLRSSAWFRMNTQMITENGPTAMQIDYVLPDRMHQTVTVKLADKTTELILVGNQAWAKEGEGWRPVPSEVANQLRQQMDETVVTQQTDVGAYACKGHMTVDGRDVLAYKLDSEGEKGSSAPANQAYRMFYVDALTGLPASNTLVAPGHEDKPIFRTSYTFPIDLKIEPPKNILATEPTPAAPPQDAKP
jgi:hypothetical protein